MKKLNTDLIKDFIVSILIVACIILIFSVIFYDKISLSKVIPKSEEYSLSDEMQEDIDESLSEEGTEIVTTYYIDAADLKQYERTKEYNKGKKNPFAMESSSVTNKVNNTTNTDNTDKNNETSASNSTNFYEDDGTK